MNPWRTIFRDARGSLIVLAVAIGIALALAFGSGHLESSLNAELRQGRNQTSSLQATLAGKQQDLAYLEAHIDEFRTLKQQGLLSAPQRETWIEQLLAARQQLGLPDTLAYSLPPPMPMTEGEAGSSAPGEAGVDGPDVPLAHDIEINLRDIHEGELLALLKAFRHGTHDHFRVQSCRLGSPAPTGLTAQCTLRSFTLPPPAAATGGGAS